MASKGALMSALFTQLTSLINELTEMYPNDTDFPLALTTIQLLKTTNPSMVVKFMDENLSKFEDKINAKDQSFFLDYSYAEWEGYVDVNIFSKLKEYHSTMAEQSKEAMWLYVTNIMRLAKACR